MTVRRPDARNLMRRAAVAAAVPAVVALLVWLALQRKKKRHAADDAEASGATTDGDVQVAEAAEFTITTPTGAAAAGVSPEDFVGALCMHSFLRGAMRRADRSAAAAALEVQQLTSADTELAYKLLAGLPAPQLMPSGARG